MSESVRSILFFVLLIFGVTVVVRVGLKFIKPVPAPVRTRPPKSLAQRILQGAGLAIAALAAIMAVIIMAVSLFAGSDSAPSYSLIEAWLVIVIGIPLVILLFVYLARKMNGR